MMPSISLPGLPKEKEFEEYCSAFLQLSGGYVEGNIIERDVEEVLEMDIIVTDYDETPPKMTLVEAKSEGWGFADLFKVSGWKQYLDITNCKVVVNEEKDNMDFIRDKVKKMGIDLVLMDDLSE